MKSAMKGDRLNENVLERCLSLDENDSTGGSLSVNWAGWEICGS